MMRFNDIVSFHNNLKKSMMTKVLPMSEKWTVGLTIQIQSMTPGVFFNQQMKRYLREDCLLVNQNFFRQQFEFLWITLPLPLTRKEIRQIQFLLEYAMMTYMFLFNENSFFTQEFENLTHQQLYCIHTALHEYETPVLSLHKDKPSPVFEAIQYCIQFEHDLFLTIIRHIVSRSIAKVCYCQRDIYYMNLLKNMSAYNQHDIAVTPVSTRIALYIQREYEHMQYKKDTIYKYNSLWQNIDVDTYAYCHSYFSQSHYIMENEETLMILTNNKALGNLYLIYDSQKMDISKEYQAILAILTTCQENTTTDMTIYYDSRFNMNYLSDEYNNAFDPIPTTITVPVHNVIMGFNKLSSLCSQKIYSQEQKEDTPTTSTSNAQTKFSIPVDNCAENPNIVSSDDYEDTNITFESFILEYLHWAAVYGKKWKWLQ